MNEYHYYISTLTDWAVGDTLLDTILKLPEPSLSKDICPYVQVWKVPGGRKARYTISMYSPQVEGAELIYSHNGGDADDAEELFIPGARMIKQGRQLLAITRPDSDEEHAA